MSYGIYENLEAGADSLTVTASQKRRAFAESVYETKRDFGKYLASYEDEFDLQDRVANVQAELEQAGVRDVLAVLEAVAADFGDSDEDDDETGPEDDDSDVPDFVDTDEDDDKERDDDTKKESSKKVAVDVPLPGTPATTPQPGGAIRPTDQGGATTSPVAGGGETTVPLNTNPAPSVAPVTERLSRRASLPRVPRIKK